MKPARKYRYEYRQRKKALQKEIEEERRLRKEAGWRGVVKEILGWLIYIAIIVAVTFLIVTYVGQRTRVSGSSMETTLQNGDNLIVDKISYRFREPKRFEVIVFPHDDSHYIKRIIGLPGETVQIIDGYVYIDGKKLDENFGKEIMENPGCAAKPITLGEDEYFVLGDNRNESSDSRFFSKNDTVTKDIIVGRAFVRIWPFDKIGVVLHEED